MGREISCAELVGLPLWTLVKHVLLGHGYNENGFPDVKEWVGRAVKEVIETAVAVLRFWRGC